MTRYSDTSARTAVGQAIKPHFPAGGRWQLVEHEGAVDDSDRVRVRVNVREIAPGGTGHAAMHRVTTRCTFTIPTDGLEAAEAQLDTDMDLFLFALDAAGVPWSAATKSQFTDEGGRLGYSLDVETFTNPTESGETTNG